MSDHRAIICSLQLKKPKKKVPIRYTLAYKLKHVCLSITFIEEATQKWLVRAPHVHQRKTKYFIAKLFAQPFDS